MKKYYLPFFVIISFLSGCSDNVVSSEDQFDSSVNGQTIIINTNHKFTLELDLHADGGYHWDYSISDTAIVQIDVGNGGIVNRAECLQ